MNYFVLSVFAALVSAEAFAGLWNGFRAPAKTAVDLADCEKARVKLSGLPPEVDGGAYEAIIVGAFAAGIRAAAHWRTSGGASGRRTEVLEKMKG